ncbi:MAG: DUF4278 domain-containing protein [Leptolyngbyaceae cyanobacterium RM1_406_9]|nr:DUF4278 domain-containing protein [Leptolyngbyaceae cyanobacterium RM1_406_9]
MKLKYRGIPYEYTPAVVQAVDTNVVAKYRGVPYKLQELVTEPFFQPVLNLKYRGISYQIGETARDDVEPIAQRDLETSPSIAVTIVKAQLLRLNIWLHQPTGNH